MRRRSHWGGPGQQAAQTDPATRTQASAERPTCLPCLQCVCVCVCVCVCGWLVHGWGRQERANGPARKEDLHSGSSEADTSCGFTATLFENVGTIVWLRRVASCCLTACVRQSRVPAGLSGWVAANRSMGPGRWATIQAVGAGNRGKNRELGMGGSVAAVRNASRMDLACDGLPPS